VGVVEITPGDIQTALGSSYLLRLLQQELAVRLQVRLDGGGVCAGYEWSAQLGPDFF
jgi:hypothetical protein